MTKIMKSFILCRSNPVPRSSFLIPRKIILRYSLRKRQGCPGIDAEGDDKHRLDGVDDEHEPESLLISYAIENQHGLDGKVPGTSTIGRWHNDSEVGYDKGYQRTTNPQMGRKVEAEERQVVMQKYITQMPMEKNR